MKRKKYKTNKYIGLSSGEYQELKKQDIDFSKSVDEFLNSCKCDKYNFDDFFDKEIENKFEVIEKNRENEKIITMVI